MLTGRRLPWSQEASLNIFRNGIGRKTIRVLRLVCHLSMLRDVHVCVCILAQCVTLVWKLSLCD